MLLTTRIFDAFCQWFQMEFVLKNCVGALGLEAGRVSAPLTSVTWRSAVLKIVSIVSALSK